MKKKLPNLSIFFPFWNEEENVEQVVKKAIPVANSISGKWEILIIDDGSSDNTLQNAKKLAKEYKNIRIISHQPNRGYGSALKAGLENAQYDYIVFTDGDGQFDFSQVARFVEKIDAVDIVIGLREKRSDHPFRHILMNLLKIWDFVFFRFYFQDIDCGFKMFKKSAVKQLLPLQSEGAMITTEILAKATRKHLKIAQVKVTHFPRKFGDQSGGNIRVILRAVKESMRLWWSFHYGRT